MVYKYVSLINTMVQAHGLLTYVIHIYLVASSFPISSLLQSYCSLLLSYCGVKLMQLLFLLINLYIGVPFSFFQLYGVGYLPTPVIYLIYSLFLQL